MHKQETIERLYRLCYERMTVLATVMLHEEEAARDVVSGIFTDMAEGRLLIPEGNAEGYLLVATRNRCLNQLRDKSRKERAEQLLALDLETAAETPPEEKLDKLDLMLSFIDRELTPQTARVLRLRFQQGLKYREIASELGISEQAVYKHLVQGITRLKEQFNP